jgi:hypothetical protein
MVEAQTLVENSLAGQFGINSAVIASGTSASVQKWNYTEFKQCGSVLRNLLIHWILVDILPQIQSFTKDISQKWLRIREASFSIRTSASRRLFGIEMGPVLSSTEYTTVQTSKSSVCLDLFSVQTQIPTTCFWFDASDPNGNGTLLANNANVSSWADKSGNGKNATTNTNHPIFTRNSLNKLPTLRFNGATLTANYLDIPAFDFGTTNRTESLW